MQTMPICLKQSKLLTSSVDREDDGAEAVSNTGFISACPTEAGTVAARWQQRT